LRDWSVDVQDLAAPRRVHLGLTGLNARLENFSLVDGAAMPFEFALRWTPAGTVRALGTVALKPMKADFKLAVDSLALLPLSPYLEDVINARLADGVASLNGRVTLALADGRPPTATFAGDAWLERFSLLDNRHVEELAGFSDLIVDGLKMETAPQPRLVVADVHLNAPYARVVMEQDHNLNLASVFSARRSGSGAGPASMAPPLSPVSLPGGAGRGRGPDIEVARMVVSGGELSLTDRSITPQVRVALGGFAGTLTGLSSADPMRGEADLRAKVGGTAPLTIKGRFDPLGPNLLVDATVGLQGLDLPPFSPYAEKYAGFELTRG
jgi:hypothetical protein